jgi:hypothetical protein
MGAPGRAASAWTEAVRWWATYAVLQDLGVPGLDAVRRDVRQDVRLSRFLHAQSQVRLAALGAWQGLPVELEPSKDSGGPGDVRIGPVFVEVLTFGEADSMRKAEALWYRCRNHLWALERNGIYWEGELPGDLDVDAVADWEDQTAEAAARCAATGQAVPVETDGTTVTARPGDAPRGTIVTGPLTEVDQGWRLLGKLRGKCETTRGAGTAWMWVEDHVGLSHPHAAFNRMPLHGKIDALGQLLGPLLKQHPHVAGVVVSTTARQQLPQPESAERPAGLGLRRALPLDRVRETLIIHRRLVLHDQIQILARLCHTEPGWLDWALARLRVPAGLASLLSAMDGRRSSNLWTPPKRATRTVT